MSFRPPPNTPRITVDDLLPGDVILSAGAINPANPNKKVPPNQAYMQLLGTDKLALNLPVFSS
ncbi:hypothetical protein N9O70_01770 [bacterium]|nr:hypothetical protein [bacterium]